MHYSEPSMKARVGRILRDSRKEAARGPFRPEWDSLRNYRVPEWYADAKFGIFIHWGLYSVPAYANEWYTRNLYNPDDDAGKHHRETYGEPTKFGLKDFIPMFRAEKWDPRDWARLFKRAGARFVVPVAEHHDGFALYDTGLSRWNAVRMGPKRDLIGDLSKALKKEGLVFGLSTHRAEHWWFMDYGTKFPSDVTDPAFADFYGPARHDHEVPDEAFLDDWQARTCELITKYDPQVLYFDWWIEQPAFAARRREIAAFYYNRAARARKGVVLNYKNDAFPEGAAVLDIERGTLPGIRPLTWQTCTSVGWKSWGYLEKEDYKDAGVLLRDFIDIVSKNGVLLLNIGPRPDGTIPDEAVARLTEFGDWLGVNGEAIYGTRPWLDYGEGPNRAQGGMFTEGKVTYGEGDVRYTRKGNAVYAISMAVPTRPVTLNLFGRKAQPDLEVESIELLGSGEKIEWKREDARLVIQAPRKAPCRHAVAFKLALSGFAIRGTGSAAEGSGFRANGLLQNYDSESVKKTVVLESRGRKLKSAEVRASAGGTAEFTLDFPEAGNGIHPFRLLAEGRVFARGVQAVPSIPLAGEWRFSKGDRPAWKTPKYDDSSWERVTLPAKWEDHSNYTEDKVYGWFRKSVFIPKEWKGAVLELPLGKIDDCDIAYFNGVEIGRTGVFPPKFAGEWSKPRRYRVDPKLVKWGAENVIAVRVYDEYGGGGIYAHPLGPIEVTGSR